ncbi:MAG: hypothetical protein N3D14_02160 [Aquificaceae bacterium]|nr:hypothetical protein [Aquificaceae bacterium]
MKGKILLAPILFLQACAPLMCPEAEDVKRINSEVLVPNSYEASLSIRYGLLRLPLYLQKKDGKFTITGEGKTAEFTLDSLCFGGVCLEMPVSPDHLLFGKVLKGNERLECTNYGLYFERDDGLFRSRYVFKEGRLNLAEFYDSRKNRALKLNYLQWSKEGYAKAIRIEGDNLSLLLTVDALKF